MCDDKASFAADKYLMYINGCARDFAFALDGREGNIITCTQKTRNLVAANTVPVTVVLRTFSQALVVLGLIIKCWSG